jgi:hypothetical protein
MGQLHFKSAAAAEMLMRTHQGTRISLRLEEIGRGKITMRLLVTLDGAELMATDEGVELHVGDTIVVPQDISVNFST